MCNGKYLFNVQPLDFAVYLRSDMSLDALIVTYSRPPLRASGEVFLLHEVIAKVFKSYRNRAGVM